MKPLDIKVAVVEGRLIGVMALVALGLRFVTVPWDFGGFFLQAWLSAVGTAGFAALLPHLNARQRALAWCLVPCLAFCFFGTLYFAAQTIIPFFFLAAAAGVALWLWSQSKIRPAMLVALLLVPFGGCCGYSVNHIALLARFRGLEAGELREIKFQPAEGQVIVVRDTNTLTRIAASLRSTSPYSPNHEGIRNRWQMTLVPTAGPPIHCSVGKGNRAHPEMAWIQFGEEVYQNPALPLILAEGVGLREFGP